MDLSIATNLQEKGKDSIRLSFKPVFHQTESSIRSGYCFDHVVRVSTRTARGVPRGFQGVPGMKKVCYVVLQYGTLVVICHLCFA